MHSVKRILTTENPTCAIRPTAIQSLHHIWFTFLLGMGEKWLRGGGGEWLGGNDKGKNFIGEMAKMV